MMKDSLSMAKTADTEDHDSAPIRSIQPVRDGPESDLNALRRTVQRAGYNLHGAICENIASELAHMPRSQRASALRGLQQTRGNRYVGGLAVQAKLKVGQPGDRCEEEADRVTDKSAKSTPANEAQKGQTEPFQLRNLSDIKTDSFQVTATFHKGETDPVVKLGSFVPKYNAIVAKQRVRPSGNPTVHNTGGNSCQPGVETLSWRVVDTGIHWRADVQSMNVSGNIHITPWPSHPNNMTVPNTPNPVNGGNINNTPASPNYWRTVIADLADYDTVGGGAGPNWHTTAASSAHEWAHWNRDYLLDAILAGNWRQTNQQIDVMFVPKAAHTTAAAARTALAPQVDGRFNRFVRAVTRRWNYLGNVKDRPGRGGRGYAAGARVLRSLIQRVRVYARSQGWR